MKIIADKRLEGAGGMISGANKDDFHLMRLAFDEHFKVESYADLRSVAEGEPCVTCGAPLRITRAIEIGHIFKLGTRYSEALGARFLDSDGTEKPIIMGSYGIGVERILSAYLEQNYDENGIIWNNALAPFPVEIIGLKMTSELVTTAAERLYADFAANGIETLYDDRTDVSAGVKFNDADLLGMPLQIICGEKNLKGGNVELKIRRTGERLTLPIDNVLSHVAKARGGVKGKCMNKIGCLKGFGFEERITNFTYMVKGKSRKENLNGMETTLDTASGTIQL